MPRFSVVVPVYEVQGYLRACLDSVLGQSFTDLEVVAVDDRSPDHSGRILDEYARRDPRVKVLHLPRNVGLGRARNAGVEQARGDYLLFLDSDDTYLPGALAAVDRRLTACGDPELLVFDHQRSYWTGRTEPSSFAAQLAATGTATSTVAERPELLTLFHVAWNKAYRRDFYQREGLRFAPGLYEDAPVSHAAMVTARSIGCLSRICVDYRQRHRGAITSTPGRRHFDIFGQYASLFAFLDGRPDLDRYRPLLFERMVAHLLFCVRRRDRVRLADRPAFFREAARLYRAHLPPGYRPAPRAARDTALLARHAYPLFAAREAVRRTAGALRRAQGPARAKLAAPVHRAYYAWQRRLPLDRDLAVYSAYWNRGVACNPAAIEATARELAPHLHPVWIVRRAAVPTLPPGTDHVVPRTLRYWKVLARATWFVNNVNFPDHLVRRPGQRHLMTHHGTPLKTMGLDQLPHPAAANGTDFARMLERAGRWDYSLTSNPHSAEVWHRAFPCSYEDLPYGYPRNDRYTTATAADVVSARERLGLPPGRIALLYAPTLRDYRTDYVPDLDLEELAEQLGERFVLLVRTHYFYGRRRHLRELHARGVIRDVSRHPSTEELCLAADALVTDYSSLMFDFACLDRPLVVHAPDWDAYRAARGVCFDLLSGRPGDTPGPVTRTTEQLAAVFRTGAWHGAESAALRAAFRERFCPWDDGHAAERVVRRVFLGEDPAALPPVVPLTERRPAPSPAAAFARTAARTTATDHPADLRDDLPDALPGAVPHELPDAVSHELPHEDASPATGPEQETADGTATVTTDGTAAGTADGATAGTAGTGDGPPAGTAAGGADGDGPQPTTPASAPEPLN
ncbi:bifunctional glycosyltransferase/CDP-glycerol:glycerophosphate glycerophosphotransferase [Streptomyces cacaoi]|uniref:bifunctional glycosyltransferase/CDP-glycerol:glycerophosphate glycerophosphotransferase n=1 Tax=Streptomyces cacaoi TaxID=1898 RepID=UPI0011F18CBE|nr:CDP-glycerol glycerophosphotransferase family protein [Streptomyces cacaoi]